ncbi:MAG: hypothetical protein SFX18_06765 [Pirellulales bacterium]|nr:hypothetical protein [Pirellulales bacterium]
MKDTFNPYRTWLGLDNIAGNHISSENTSGETPNHYQLLNLELFEANTGLITQAAERQLSRLLKITPETHREVWQRLVGELAAAQSTLSHPRHKREYDESLKLQIKLNREAAPSKGRKIYGVEGAAPRKPLTLAEPVAAISSSTANASQQVPVPEHIAQGGGEQPRDFASSIPLAPPVPPPVAPPVSAPPSFVPSAPPVGQPAYSPPVYGPGGYFPAQFPQSASGGHPSLDPSAVAPAYSGGTASYYTPFPATGQPVPLEASSGLLPPHLLPAHLAAQHSPPGSASTHPGYPPGQYVSGQYPPGMSYPAVVTPAAAVNQPANPLLPVQVAGHDPMAPLRPETTASTLLMDRYPMSPGTSLPTNETSSAVLSGQTSAPARTSVAHALNRRHNAAQTYALFAGVMLGGMILVFVLASFAGNSKSPVEIAQNSDSSSKRLSSSPATPTRNNAASSKVPFNPAQSKTMPVLTPPAPAAELPNTLSPPADPPASPAQTAKSVTNSTIAPPPGQVKPPGEATNPPKSDAVTSAELTTAPALPAPNATTPPPSAPGNVTSPTNPTPMPAPNPGPGIASQPSTPPAGSPQSEPSQPVSAQPVPPQSVPPAQNTPPPVQATAEQEKAFWDILREVRSGLAERNFDFAVEKLKSARELAVSADLQAHLQSMEEVAEYTREFWSAVQESMRTLDGEIEIGSSKANVVNSTASEITIRRNGKNENFKFNSLPTGLAVVIAKKWFNSEPGNKAILGAFYFVQVKVNKIADARQLWTEAQQQGVDCQGMLVLIDKLGL